MPWGLIILAIFLFCVLLFFVYSLISHSSGSDSKEPVATDNTVDTDTVDSGGGSGTDSGSGSGTGGGVEKDLSINPEHQGDIGEVDGHYTGLFYTGRDEFGEPQILAIGRRGDLTEITKVDGQLVEKRYNYTWGSAPSTFECTLQGLVIDGEPVSIDSYYYGTRMSFHLYMKGEELYITNISFPNSQNGDEDIRYQDITYTRERNYNSIEEMTEAYFGNEYSV